MKYQGHRGIEKEYPENTMASYRAAVRCGYDIIELDPAVTSDGVFVMLHDRTINRTARDKDGIPTREELPISDITYEMASSYEYGSWFDEKFRGEPIPLVSDVLAFARESGVRLKIDNKFESFDPEMRKKFLALFSYGANNITFSVLTMESAIEIFALYPDCNLCFDGITDEPTLKELSGLFGEHLEVWIPLRTPRTLWWKKEFLTPEIATIVSKYAKLGIWCLDEPSELEWALEFCEPYALETTGGIKPPTAKN